ncbi:MAG: hypothetical protein WAX07_05760 [Candidatus Altiarchaeia archaeon]
MAKVVFEGIGSLITGACPRCPERVTVLVKHGESYKNAKCIYCGADIHGDAISEIIREGHCPGIDS